MNCRIVASFLLLVSSLVRAADEVPKLDPRYPFRTDFANPQLPWYQPKPLEFPPHHSDRRISGELVSADFIHRTGQFRASKNGELMDFTMPPYGAINYLNAEADLRDVPLGTFFLFFLNQDAHGGFTRLATMQDQFTMDMGHSFTYRLDEAKPGEGKLLTTKHSLSKKQDGLGKKELIFAKETRVWKLDKQIKIEDLKPGDVLLLNFTVKTATDPGWCTDIWSGTNTHQLIKDTQQKKFNDFTKFRGLPGWIDKTEGKTVTLTLFSGDVAAFKKAWPEELAKDKEIRLAVANDELRTWNPPVDGERGSIVEVEKVPTECYGCSGVRLTVTVSNMLEGFRRGRVVRMLCAGWPAKDQSYGESLMGYGFGKMQDQELNEIPAKEYPDQFPFRTEYGNEQVSWYQLRPGQEPPPGSEHVVYGELVKVNDDHRSGQFRTDRTGDSVDFTLIDSATVKYLNATAPLSDIPVRTRCRFHLYEDANGAFTKASLVSDEFSSLASNFVTWRISALKLNDGKIFVERQIPEVKDYNGDMQRPPDVGRTVLRVTNDTRVWKDGLQVKLADLAIGDALLVNQTGEMPDKPSRCTDIWSGEATHKLASEQERAKNDKGKAKAK
ncbi:MAG: hypothetical protein JWO94_3829 [Verrucomicrobiaceae bacterium]|nr:hypothetical protein [Verrucomicrobiaceae bacterium]